MDDLVSRESVKLGDSWAEGLRLAFPVMLGYIPVGFAFGVLAQKFGLSPLNALLMSLLVYAGSSQYIAIGLLAASAPWLSVVFTTFVVNLRMMLMSAALSPFLRAWSKPELALFAQQLTDETFAVHATQFAAAPPEKRTVFIINMGAQASWVLGTWLGLLGGQLVPNVEQFGLDYALPALFIALLLMQIKNRVQVAVAIATGLLSVGLLLLGMDQWNVIVAALIGATAGVVMESWTKK
ncbi:MAG: AzlC family ABC transporter permease [Anaerolineae bacterium]|jgi:4-azaleucine resistance transporter AzlC|nr:AzlC family ABC transporter permease [Anaerolineae bacterium]